MSNRRAMLIMIQVLLLALPALPALGQAQDGAPPAPAAGAAPAAVSGSQPWVTLLCKFADVPAEPRPPSYFQSMLATTYPGLDHYWRELSFGLLNIAGSTAVDRWYTLPQPRAYYVYDMTGDGRPDLDANRALADCAATADSVIYYPSFYGINMMFNEELDGSAFGARTTLTLDGVERTWGVTMNPPRSSTPMATATPATPAPCGSPARPSTTPPIRSPSRWRAKPLPVSPSSSVTRPLSLPSRPRPHSHRP